MVTQGYLHKVFSIPAKRYCQTLELKDDSELIDEYVTKHSEMYHWPEVRDRIRSIGILAMEIYRFETKLFIIEMNMQCPVTISSYKVGK